MKEKKLPKKNWQLLELSLKCMEHVLNRKDEYIINMDKWAVQKRKCHVCMGGAVMAVYLRKKSDDLDDFCYSDSDKLANIDSMRCGRLNCIIPPNIINKEYDEIRDKLENWLRNIYRNYPTRKNIMEIDYAKSWKCPYYSFKVYKGMVKLLKKLNL